MFCEKPRRWSPKERERQERQAEAYIEAYKALWPRNLTPAKAIKSLGVSKKMSYWDWAQLLENRTVTADDIPVFIQAFSTHHISCLDSVYTRSGYWSEAEYQRLLFSKIPISKWSLEALRAMGANNGENASFLLCNKSFRGEWRNWENINQTPDDVEKIVPEQIDALLDGLEACERIIHSGPFSYVALHVWKALVSGSIPHGSAQAERALAYIINEGCLNDVISYHNYPASFLNGLSIESWKMIAGYRYLSYEAFVSLTNNYQRDVRIPEAFWMALLARQPARIGRRCGHRGPAPDWWYERADLGWSVSYEELTYWPAYQYCTGFRAEIERRRRTQNIGRPLISEATASELLDILRETPIDVAFPSMVIANRATYGYHSLCELHSRNPWKEWHKGYARECARAYLSTYSDAELAFLLQEPVSYKEDILLLDQVGGEVRRILETRNYRHLLRGVAQRWPAGKSIIDTPVTWLLEDTSTEWRRRLVGDLQDGQLLEALEWARATGQDALAGSLRHAISRRLPPQLRPKSSARSTLTSKSSNSAVRHFRRATRIVWPDVEELIERVKAASLVAVAAELGVSDVGLRKRLLGQGVDLKTLPRTLSTPGARRRK